VEVEGDELARNALTPIAPAQLRSTLITDAGDMSREFARELQADNDELRETNRQICAAMEEMHSLNVTLQSVNEALHTANIELRTDLDAARTRVHDLEHMLNGIGVAAVLLNEALEVCDYNTIASRFFVLEKQDIGRSISRVRHNFAEASLVDLCREAKDTGEPLERIATTNAGDLVSVRAREVDLGAANSGLMLTVMEITDLGLEPASRFT
jgi:nitrogen fixation/metabolism regulation signal transduction histidine kinase